MAQASPDNGWVNTSDGQNPRILAKAWQILESTIYGTLSTCSPDGWPWASPIFFGYDGAWTLYWSSAQVARHSQNLYTNQGRAALTIYSTDRAVGQGQGLYLAGTATEVDATAVDRILPHILARSAQTQRRSPDDYRDPSPRRIYGFQPEDVWITGDRVAISDRLWMDTKIHLDLAQLRAWAPHRWQTES